MSPLSTEICCVYSFLSGRGLVLTWRLRGLIPVLDGDNQQTSWIGAGDPTESWLLWAWMCPGVGYRPLRVPPTLLAPGRCAARASWLCLLFLLQRFDSIPTWLQRSPGKCLKRYLRWERFLLPFFILFWDSDLVHSVGSTTQRSYLRLTLSQLSLCSCAVVSSPWETRSWRHRARSVFPLGNALGYVTQLRSS